MVRTGRDWPLLVVLMLDAVLLAVLELVYLPLRFDGYLLPNLGGWPFPVTALVAALTMPWLVSQSARIADRALGGGAPLWAWLITVAAFGFAGPGGDVVLLPDWRTLLLIAAGMLPAAVALGSALGRTGRARAGR